MNILGINAYHANSSACLVIDGEVINAIEEERIRRIKYWGGFPIEAIKWCLSNAKIIINDVDFIAISRNPSAQLHKKILYVLGNIHHAQRLKSRISDFKKVINLKSILANEFFIDVKSLKSKILNVEHHLSHIASAFFVSPFNEAACVSVDGFGDFASTMRATVKGNNIKIIDRVDFPNSLGIFYTGMTQYLGFWNYGDEYKVMGLAAYGEPKFLNEMRQIIKLKPNGLFELDNSYFLRDKEGVETLWNDGKPFWGTVFSRKLSQLLGPARKNEDEITQHHLDIAASTQTIYEETFFHMLNDIYNKTKLDNLVLAGGCIQNSLANGKIYEKTAFKKLYISPASDDAGTAIGSAMIAWNKVSEKQRNFIMEHPYLGPSFTEKQINDCIHGFSNELSILKCKTENIHNQETICTITASEISKGKIIGWFQGRTEFGPRALGNRSILADPRRKDMKDILNSRIKKREWFRPFAPSILEEKITEWFENSNPVPFMEKVYKINKDKQRLIPAVCHIDGTGRLQTVSKKTNPRFYMLITEFENITGIPILLNTSFNENEPIVNSPEDAIKCFLRTKMDILVLENYIITKTTTSHESEVLACYESV